MPAVTRSSSKNQPTNLDTSSISPQDPQTVNLDSQPLPTSGRGRGTGRGRGSGKGHAKANLKGRGRGCAGSADHTDGPDHLDDELSDLSDIPSSPIAPIPPFEPPRTVTANPLSVLPQSTRLSELEPPQPTTVLSGTPPLSSNNPDSTSTVQVTRSDFGGGVLVAVIPLALLRPSDPLQSSVALRATLPPSPLLSSEFNLPLLSSGRGAPLSSLLVPTANPHRDDYLVAHALSSAALASRHGIPTVGHPALPSASGAATPNGALSSSLLPQTLPQHPSLVSAQPHLPMSTTTTSIQLQPHNYSAIHAANILWPNIVDVPGSANTHLRPVTQLPQASRTQAPSHIQPVRSEDPPTTSRSSTHNNPNIASQATIAQAQATAVSEEPRAKVARLATKRPLAPLTESDSAAHTSKRPSRAPSNQRNAGGLMVQQPQPTTTQETPITLTDDTRLRILAKIEELKKENARLKALAQPKQVAAQATLIPKPPGQAGGGKRGYNLKEAMQLKGQHAFYNAIHCYVRRLVVRYMDITRTFKAQSLENIDNVATAARAKYPYLERFVNDWATIDMIKVFLINYNRHNRRRRNMSVLNAGVAGSGGPENHINNTFEREGTQNEIIGELDGEDDEMDYYENDDEIELDIGAAGPS